MVFTFEEILFILMVHLLADFSVQTHMQAENKSTNLLYLLKHTITYSLIWGGFFFVFSSNLEDTLLFTGITFIAHTLTDFVTSKMVKERFDKEDHHNGFFIIGVDQVLHYFQLLLTIKLFI